jgi:HEAT repeat protein
MEVLNAIASHDKTVAVPLLLELSRQSPPSRAVLQVLARTEPEAAVTRLVEMSDADLVAISLSLSTGELRKALAATRSPAAAKRLMALAPHYLGFDTLVQMINPEHAALELEALLHERGLLGLHRLVGLKLLARVLRERSIPTLVAALRHELRVVREDAAEALITLGDGADDAAVGLLVHKELGLEQALRIVSALSSRRAVEPLRRLLQTPDESLRPQIAELLARISGAEAEDAIMPLVQSRILPLRMAVARAFAHIPTSRAVEQLRALAASDVQKVQELALDSLRKLGAHSSPVQTSALRALLSCIKADGGSCDNTSKKGWNWSVKSPTHCPTSSTPL